MCWGETPLEAQFLHERANDTIIHAYVNHLFEQPSAIARRRLYDLHLFFVMFIECAYRTYPTDDIEQPGGWFCWKTTGLRPARLAHRGGNAR